MSSTESDKLAKRLEEAFSSYLTSCDITCGLGPIERRRKAERQQRNVQKACSIYSSALLDGLPKGLSPLQTQEAIRTRMGPVAWWILGSLVKALLWQLLQWAVSYPATITSCMTPPETE